MLKMILMHTGEKDVSFSPKTAVNKFWFLKDFKKETAIIEANQSK